MAETGVETAQNTVPTGTHIVSNCYGCDFSEIRRLGMDGTADFISSLVRKHGLTEVGRSYHSFGAPDAFTGVSVLAESHITVHTWPEIRFVSVDVYVCNVSRDNTEAAKALYGELEAFLRPTETKMEIIER
jgi:S-adenosylmethionine decarboxylase